MLSKQAAPDGVLQRREGELGRTVGAQEETDPAAAQRADAVEHHDGLIGGWVSWIRRAQASPRRGSVARTAAARLRPRTCSAITPRPRGRPRRDRTSVLLGTRVSVRVALGGRRIIPKKTKQKKNQ